MVRATLILFIWALIGFRLNLQWVELYELTYSITILLSSIVLSMALRERNSKLMLLPFLFSLPIIISNILALLYPLILINEVAALACSIIIITYLLKQISYGVIR